VCVCVGVMCKYVYICVPECTHKEMRHLGQEKEEGGGDVRWYKVIICVFFERWMNGVKIALICRGTVLPSGLMSVPG